MFLPITAKANIYQDALRIMGVTLNTPSNPDVYLYTWQVFDKFNKGQKFNLTLDFKDRKFSCGNVKLAYACYTPSKRLITIMGNPSTMDFYRYKFVLTHEYGHSTGITDELEADNFARRYK